MINVGNNPYVKVGMLENYAKKIQEIGIAGYKGDSVATRLYNKGRTMTVCKALNGKDKLITVVGPDGAKIAAVTIGQNGVIKKAYHHLIGYASRLGGGKINFIPIK